MRGQTDGRTPDGRMMLTARRGQRNKMTHFAIFNYPLQSRAYNNEIRHSILTTLVVNHTYITPLYHIRTYTRWKYDSTRYYAVFPRKHARKKQVLGLWIAGRVVLDQFSRRLTTGCVSFTFGYSTETVSQQTTESHHGWMWFTTCAVLTDRHCVNSYRPFKWPRCSNWSGLCVCVRTKMSELNDLWHSGSSLPYLVYVWTSEYRSKFTVTRRTRRTVLDGGSRSNRPRYYVTTLIHAGHWHMTMTCDLYFQSQASYRQDYTHKQAQIQRSVGSKDRLETNGRTDRRTLGKNVPPLC